MKMSITSVKIDQSVYQQKKNASKNEGTINLQKFSDDDYDAVSLRIEAIANCLSINSSRFVVTTYSNIDTALYDYAQNVQGQPSIFRSIVSVQLPTLSTLNYLHCYDMYTAVEMYVDAPSNSRFLLYKNMASQMSFRVTNALNKWLFAVFTAGDDIKVPIAFIGINGILYFHEMAIATLWYQIGAMKTCSIIKKIFDFQSLQKDVYEGQNPAELGKDLITSILLKIERNAAEGRMTLLDNKTIINEINKQLRSLCAGDVADFNRGGIDISGIHYSLLMNQGTLYKKALIQIINASDSLKKDAFNQGMQLGMSVFSRIAKCGFSLKDEKNYGKVWVKKVKIIPEKCYQNGVLYILEDAFRKYHVDKLIIDPKLFSGREIIVHCEGDHPNVSRSDHRVCLGYDLTSRWNTITTSDSQNISVEVIEYFFRQIEEVLEIINFDSSYKGLNNDFTPKQLGPQYKNALRKFEADHTKRNITKETGRDWVELD